MKKFIYVILISAAIILLIKYTSADEQLRTMFTQPCGQPIEYTIGIISPTYQLSEAKLKKILSDIDQAWSSAAGKELFRYNENAGIKVNIIYDEQQRFLDEEKSISSRIQHEKRSYKIAEQKLSQLKERYTQIKKEYDDALAEYKKMMKKPSTQIKNDVARQAYEVEQKRKELNDLAQQLNKKVEVMNGISDRIDKMVANYNADFDTTREYNQGDYQKNITDASINIYSYRDLHELKLVLAHEMGHAIGLKHVENSESIMYYLIKDQLPDSLTFSAQDRAALQDLCGT